MPSSNMEDGTKSLDIFEAFFILIIFNPILYKSFFNSLFLR